MTSADLLMIRRGIAEAAERIDVTKSLADQEAAEALWAAANAVHIAAAKMCAI